ncbi:hypothetical protein MBLNU13_g10839t1 [Cladosporium sp. NU13]
MTRILRGFVAPRPVAGAGEDVQRVRGEVEANITKVRIELTQLVNTMMERMQAEAERRAEMMLQQLTRMLKTAPKNDIGRAAPISESEPTSGRSTRTPSNQGQAQPTRAAQPSWAAIASSGAQKMTGWTTVTNGKKKPKKHSLSQRRILFVRNAQSPNCDPRDIMFEVNRALANARAHVTVRLIKMGYTDKGNLTGVVGENACAEEVFAYAPAVMAAVQKLDAEVVYMDKTERWCKLRVHGVALDRYMRDGGLELARKEIELMTGEQLPWGKYGKSVIDLTLSTRNIGALSWEIDCDRATTSDHEVIIFGWTPLRTVFASDDAMATPYWNIERLCTDEQAMEKAAEHWRALSEGRPLVDPHATTEEELEAETIWIQNSLKIVLDMRAPGKADCARSKRWWTADIKQMRRYFAGARREYKAGRTSFDEYRRVRNDYYCHIRKAKRFAWERFLEGVFPTDDHSELASDPERCWRALRYTKPQVPSHTPAIKISGVDGQPDKVVATAEEKEEIFMAQAFPPQAAVVEEFSLPGTVAEVSSREVREALFTQSVKKAPGIDGIGFKALRLLWRWAEKRVVALVQGCIRVGYHSCTGKTAKGILLRKQGKPTYTVAKAYRVISLLNCLGKVVEKVIATWITSFCEHQDVFHRGQSGCRRSRSTSDAVAQLVAKVERAWGAKRTALALLLDVKGAFDRVDRTHLLKRMVEVGIAGNIVRWTDSFLSNRRAMLVIDGRTGETRAIQAGLPQGSPVSPVLFILSVSALFQWLEDRHPDLQAISFVDDIGLVIECDELEDGATRLERIARDTMQWGSDNRVEFEVSKTEVLLFSRRKRVFRAATNVVVNIGEQSFAIKQDATKWLGFWLDSKLSFKTHFENRMTSAKCALQRVASLSRSNGGLPMNLMRRVVVAAVTSVALYGSEVWWRCQQDRVNKLQLLLNSQARAITGLLRLTLLTLL